MPMPQDDFAQQGPTLQITANGLGSLDFGVRANCSTWNNFGRTVTALARFVASLFIFLRLQLRKIMAVCALLQRMEIFRGEREKSLANCARCARLGGFVRVI